MKSRTTTRLIRRAVDACLRLTAMGAAVLAFSLTRSDAQEAVILIEPASWKLETMAVPPSFAPDIRLNGTEEIRFAPGMFNTSSATYFTCLILMVSPSATDGEVWKNLRTLGAQAADKAAS